MSSPMSLETTSTIGRHVSTHSSGTETGEDSHASGDYISSHMSERLRPSIPFHRFRRCGAQKLLSSFNPSWLAGTECLHPHQDPSESRKPQVWRWCHLLDLSQPSRQFLSIDGMNFRQLVVPVLLDPATPAKTSVNFEPRHHGGKNFCGRSPAKRGYTQRPSLGVTTQHCLPLLRSKSLPKPPKGCPCSRQAHNTASV